MFRKSYFSFAAMILILTGGLAAIGQVQPTTGRVEAAAAKTPVAGATIDAFPLEVGTAKLTATSDADGNFVLADTALGKDYIIVVSAPKFAPNFLPKVPAGQAGIVFALEPGDGRKVTEADARNAVKVLETGEGGSLTPEQRAQILKEKEARAAIEAKNSKSRNDFAVASKLNDEARAALEAKNYTLAIAKADEAITAIPEFPGITPRFLLYRGVSYRDRARDAYNKAAQDKSITAEQRTEAYKAVRSDLAASLDSFAKSWTMLNAAAVTDPQLAKTVQGFKDETSSNAMSALGIAVQAKQVDSTLSTSGKGFLTDYIAKQSDATKKGEALVTLGGLLYQSNDYDGSVVEYRKALELVPENPDGLFGIAIALITSGAEKEEKAKYQEAANYLVKFETVAKSNPKYAALVAEVPEQLAILKAVDVVPEKATRSTGTRRKP